MFRFFYVSKRIITLVSHYNLNREEGEIMNMEQNGIVPVNVKKKKSILPKIILAAIAFILIAAAFLYGVIVGGKYGVKIKGFDPDKIPVTEYIVNGLRENGKIDFSVTFGEKEINEAMILFEGELAPLKNVYVNPGDGTVLLSGQVEKNELKSYLQATSKTEIPEIVWIFVPATLNLKADIALSVVDGEPSLLVNGLTVLNADTDKELLSLGGFTDVLQKLIERLISDIVPENVNLQTLTVTKDGISVCGEMGILKTNE